MEELWGTESESFSQDVPPTPDPILARATYKPWCTKCAFIRDLFGEVAKDPQCGPPQFGVSAVGAAKRVYQRVKDGELQVPELDGPWSPPEVCEHCTSAFESPYRAYPCAQTATIEILMAYGNEDRADIVTADFELFGAIPWLAFHGIAILSTLDEIVPPEVANCAAGQALRQACSIPQLCPSLQGCPVKAEHGRHDDKDCKFSHEEGRFWCLAPECTKGCNHRGLFACWEKPMAVSLCDIQVSMLSGPVFSYTVGSEEFPVLDAPLVNVADVVSVLQQIGVLEEACYATVSTGSIAMLPSTCQLRMICDFFGRVDLQVSISLEEVPIPSYEKPAAVPIDRMPESVCEIVDGGGYVGWNMFAVVADRSVAVGYRDQFIHRCDANVSFRHVCAVDILSSARLDWPFRSENFSYSLIPDEETDETSSFEILSLMNPCVVTSFGTKLVIIGESQNAPCVFLMLDLSDPTQPPIIRVVCEFNQTLPGMDFFNAIRVGQTMDARLGSWFLSVLIRDEFEEYSPLDSHEPIQRAGTADEVDQKTVSVVFLDLLTLTPFHASLRLNQPFKLVSEGTCEMDGPVSTDGQPSGRLLLAYPSLLFVGNLSRSLLLDPVEVECEFSEIGMVRFAGANHIAISGDISDEVEYTLEIAATCAVCTMAGKLVWRRHMWVEEEICYRGFLLGSLILEDELSDEDLSPEFDEPIVGLAVRSLTGSVHESGSLVTYSSPGSWASGVVDLTTNVVTEGVCVRDDGSIAVGVFDRDTGDLVSGRVQQTPCSHVVHFIALHNSNACLPAYWARSDHPLDQIYGGGLGDEENSTDSDLEDLLDWTTDESDSTSDSDLEF